MRASVIITTMVLALAAYVVAQGQGGPPAEVQRISVFACPSHAQIMATWPARCPYCGASLRRVALQGGGAFGGAPGASPGTTQPGTQQPMPGTGGTTGGFGQTFPQNQGFGQQFPDEESHEAPAQVYPPGGFGQAYPNQGYGTQGSYPPMSPYQGSGQGQYPSQYPPNQGSGQYPPQYPPNQGQQYPNPNDQYGRNEPNSGYGGILDELSRLFGRGRDTQQQPQ